MALSPTNPVKPERANERYASSFPQGKSMVQADSEQMFQLIDSILPFEACLYHQVLPLSLKGTQLNLGMVNQEDSAALDYVRRILAYMNCSLVPQPISAERHQTALSAYLNHTGQHQQLQTPKLGGASSSHKQEQPTGRHDRTTLIVNNFIQGLAFGTFMLPLNSVAFTTMSAEQRDDGSHAVRQLPGRSAYRRPPSDKK